MTDDILMAIQEKMAVFSKGQKLIASFILSSYEKAAFMTAGKLGRAVHVSESTVVRFAVELGYNGYPAMQKALQERIRSKLTSIQRIEVSNDRMGNQDILSMVMQSDIEKLRMTLEQIDRSNFAASVDAIVAARRIYLLGVRSAAAISSFLGFYLNLIFSGVVLMQENSVSEVFEQMFHIGAGDVIIGISFPRYSCRTVKAMQFARDRGATVIAITDGATSPLAPISDYTLTAESGMASFVDSLVAPLSLVNALIVALAQRMNSDLPAAFEALEQIWDEYQVYAKAGEG